MGTESTQGATVARTPSPWYWKERAAWYVTIEGKRHRLHEDEAKARKQFYRLMASDGTPDERKRGRITVAVAIEALIASVQHYRETTKRLYLYNLGPVAAKFEKRLLDSIKPEEVLAFISEYNGTGYHNRKFGDASRYLMFRYVKTLFKWCKETGLTQTNPMHGKSCPWKIMARERVMTPDEYRTVMDSGRVNDHFKLVVEFLWRTGARPGEIAKIQSRHLDARNPIVRLQPTEHKTGTKTGLQREIFLPPDLMTKLREFAKDRPNGPLLRNKKGNPWNQDTISDTWGYWRRHLGLADDCVIYLARHAWGTRAIDKGQPIARVAKMLGHNDPNTFMKHYFHPDQVAMVDAANSLDTPSDT
jgi:integrase